MCFDFLSCILVGVIFYMITAVDVVGSSPIYSVVVPVYNSGTLLPELYSRLKSVFEQLKVSFEVILVDDGSRDDSWPRIVNLCHQHQNIVRGVRFSRNFGQHNAVLCGMSKTKGQFVITIDDDLQIPPEEIPRLIAAQQQTHADCVYGLPVELQYGLVRAWGSRAMQWVVGQAFGYKGKVGAFRLLRQNVVRKVVQHNSGFIFIDGYILWHTRHIEHIAIKKQPRSYGRSGYNFVALFRLMFLLVVSYTLMPVYFIFFASGFCALMGFAIGVYNYALRHYLLYSHLTLLSLLFFLTAIVLLGLGVVALYLQRLSAMHYRAPVYSVDRTVNI